MTDTLCHTSIYKVNTCLHLHSISYRVQEGDECNKRFDGWFALMCKKSFRGGKATLYNGGFFAASEKKNWTYKWFISDTMHAIFFKLHSTNMAALKSNIFLLFSDITDDVGCHCTLIHFSNKVSFVTSKMSCQKISLFAFLKKTLITVSSTVQRLTILTCCSVCHCNSE